jgi:hypothetical protein
MSDIIERAEAALESLHAPIIAELVTALKAAQAENQRLLGIIERHIEWPHVSDLRQRLADALRQHQSWDTLICDCGWDGDDGQNSWSSHVADVLLSLPGIAIVDVNESSTGRHSIDDDRIEDGRYVVWFDSGADCPRVGCSHGWITSGKAAVDAAEATP